VVKAGGQEEIVDLAVPEGSSAKASKMTGCRPPEEQAEIICRVDDLVTINKLRLGLRGSDADF
jgi:hypothetical protein